MFDDFEPDFRVSKFEKQFVWHGSSAYSGIVSSRQFSSVQEAEDDASVVISHLFATAASSLSVDLSAASDVRPSLSIVRSSEGREFYLSAA